MFQQSFRLKEDITYVPIVQSLASGVAGDAGHLRDYLPSSPKWRQSRSAGAFARNRRAGYGAPVRDASDRLDLRHALPDPPLGRRLFAGQFVRAPAKLRVGVLPSGEAWRVRRRPDPVRRSVRAVAEPRWTHYGSTRSRSGARQVGDSYCPKGPVATRRRRVSCRLIGGGPATSGAAFVRCTGPRLTDHSVIFHGSCPRFFGETIAVVRTIHPSLATASSCTWQGAELVSRPVRVNWVVG